ncbi:hypothetical protein BLA18110_07972 [Burkholderia lata]|nr:hypothetical protein BLA18110_07972 [Burkholderia lata]
MNISSVNWIAAYNRLFILWDKVGESTYRSGPNFLRNANRMIFEGASSK